MLTAFIRAETLITAYCNSTFSQNMMLQTRDDGMRQRVALCQVGSGISIHVKTLYGRNMARGERKSSLLDGWCLEHHPFPLLYHSGRHLPRRCVRQQQAHKGYQKHDFLRCGPAAIIFIDTAALYWRPTNLDGLRQAAIYPVLNWRWWYLWINSVGIFAMVCLVASLIAAAIFCSTRIG